jgi:biopolymer transport protein ExbD
MKAISLFLALLVTTGLIHAQQPVRPVISPTRAAPASTDLYGAGLLSEEAEQDLAGAEAAYRQAIQQFDRQREGAANAIFRLGEVYRKLGRTEEAKVQYARILREFPDMVRLTELSHARLIGEEGTYQRRLQQIVRRAATPGQDSAAGTGSYDRLMMERYGIVPGATSQLSAASTQESSERGNCHVNLKNIGLSARIYAHAHQAAYPSTVLAMRDEIARPELLICPADRERQVAATWADFDPTLHMTYEYSGESATVRDVERVLFRCPIHGHSTLGDGSVSWQQTTPPLQAVTPPVHSDGSSPTYWSAVLERYGLSWEVVEDVGSEIEVVHHIRSWLRAIDGAKQQWALEKRQPQEAIPTMEDISGYMSGEPLPTIAGERYEINAIGVPPVAILTAPLGNRKPGDRITIGPPDQALNGRQTEPFTSSVDTVVLTRYGLGAAATQEPRSEVEIVNAIINRLRQIDGAKQQWALEKRQPQSARPTANDIADYLRGGFPAPIAGERYELNAVGESPVAVLTQPIGNRQAGDVITIEVPDQALPARPTEPVRIHVREDGSIEVDGERVEASALSQRLRGISKRPRPARRAGEEPSPLAVLMAEDRSPWETLLSVISEAHAADLRPLEIEGPARPRIQEEAVRWAEEIARLGKTIASLSQEAMRLQMNEQILTNELREAEERVGPAIQRFDASYSDAERLPGMISQDERYQKLRAEYETAVLDGDEEAGKRAKARLEKWVELIYRPELGAEYDFAENNVRHIRSRYEQLQARRQAVRSQLNQLQEQVHQLHQRQNALKAVVPDLEAAP